MWGLQFFLEVAPSVNPKLLSWVKKVNAGKFMVSCNVKIFTFTFRIFYYFISSPLEEYKGYSWFSGSLQIFKYQRLVCGFSFCHESNKVWLDSQDSRQIHRSAVKMAARNISCSTDAICPSTAVSTSIALAWHSKQKISVLSPYSYTIFAITDAARH